MNLSGKTAIVTGSNTGIGYETALDLFKKGAKVYIACRNQDKALKAIQKMEINGGTGELVYEQLDLASLSSVKAFADNVIQAESSLDLLINNAGIMIPPQSKTEDGFETQFGVNFVGHFALTGHLFNLLESTKGSRVVTLSSIAHRGAAIDFDNFRLEKEYNNWREYGQSKFADIIFALEFNKRLKLNGSQITSLAAHPGFSKTDLQVHMDKDMLASLELMTAKEGAQPTLAACLREDVKGGQYWGPDGHNEQKGKPAIAKIDAAALDETLNAKLWDWAKETTKADFPF
ncbi:NAD(P)-dependent dehydrogenase (short-subunit alcohol dehydrogenase family) [Winogradskyella eximia]|uniref:NAD(P)-dependent dehydrogenase (Short-subunit alcohol dehydrogenase family) n=1 Tax=Winogradskyella eximia TaxID=262006 RepID=A0A3D9GPR9_9FLAO|nr:oxidoreductase [Winogradskyella eximia]RED38496.1 NAD(P)-dependent dehydrogenase (short-subunit alcohol dehydrogenase family) [Winogradskyella eximia]